MTRPWLYQSEKNGTSTGVALRTCLVAVGGPVANDQRHERRSRHRDHREHRHHEHRRDCIPERFDPAEYEATAARPTAVTVAA